MKRPAPIFWISLGLVSITLSILVISDLIIGLIPDQSAHIYQYRQKYSEALAVQYSLLAQDGNKRNIQQALALLVERNPDIQSAAFVLASGEMLAVAGPHHETWTHPPGTSSTPDSIQIPIFNEDLLWGTLQLQFLSVADNWWFPHLSNNAWVRFLALVMGAGFVGYFLFMKGTLRQLDPSSVIPMRVKAAFDVLAEGVVFLDPNGCIVLANRAFCHIIKNHTYDLLGKTLDNFGWRSCDRDNPEMTYPWTTARQDHEVKLDVPMLRGGSEEQVRRFRVNCTPIVDERQKVRGMVVSFNDVTELDDTIRQLQASKSELETLAHRDPLTNCCNRRALFEAFEDQWEIVRRDGTCLVCLMADIDHFKSYNDRFGHAVGDQVIQAIAKVLSTTIRPLDIIGRYGGEEFCIIMPGQTLSEGLVVAERLRQNVEDLASHIIRTTSGQKITMSFGVSDTTLGASDPLELVNQADQALYAAKEGGRNRVGYWTLQGAVTRQPDSAEMACR